MSYDAKYLKDKLNVFLDEFESYTLQNPEFLSMYGGDYGEAMYAVLVQMHENEFYSDSEFYYLKRSLEDYTETFQKIISNFKPERLTIKLYCGRKPPAFDPKKTLHIRYGHISQIIEAMEKVVDEPAETRRNLLVGANTFNQLDLLEVELDDYLELVDGILEVELIYDERPRLYVIEKQAS